MTPEQLATDLKSLLLQKDFRPVQQPEDTPVFDLYIRIENPVCCVLAVQPHDSDEHREDVAAFAESLQKQLPQIQCTQLICLYPTAVRTSLWALKNCCGWLPPEKNCPKTPSGKIPQENAPW